MKVCLAFLYPVNHRERERALDSEVMFSTFIEESIEVKTETTGLTFSKSIEVSIFSFCVIKRKN